MGAPRSKKAGCWYGRGEKAGSDVLGLFLIFDWRSVEKAMMEDAEDVVEEEAEEELAEVEAPTVGQKNEKKQNKIRGRGKKDTKSDEAKRVSRGKGRSRRRIGGSGS